MTELLTVARTCSTCGEINYAPGVSRCWLCHEPLGAGPGGPRAGSAARAKSSSDGGLRFWLILVPVLAVVCFGLFHEAPGLAVGLAVLATPVLVRTLVKILRRRGAGQPMTGGEVVATVFASLGIVIMLGVSAAVAFFATCFAICLGFANAGGLHRGGNAVVNLSIGGGVVVGILAAVGTYLLLRRLLPGS
jgi:hypothetical protein